MASKKYSASSAKDIVVNGEALCAARYNKLSNKREPYLLRARECAKLTIPSLFPEEGDNESTKFVTPWQSLGARGLNTLTSKIILAMLPPGSSCFRAMADDKAIMELEQNDPKVRDDIEEALSAYEAAVNKEIETQNIRTPAYAGFLQWLLAGNVLLYLAPKGGMKVYRLNQYVVCRDPVGNVLEIITKEVIALRALPMAIQEQLPQVEDGNTDPEKTVDVYTRVYLDEKTWEMTQEIQGVVVVTETYPLEQSPWIPLRRGVVPGEAYGRSYVEEYFGDLKTLDGLTESIVAASAAGGKIVGLVNPNGITSIDDVTSAKNGAFVPGRQEDISFLQVAKYNDLRVARETVADTKNDLAYAFLLNSAIQRNGERVTAEEIRTMAQELDDANGGLYSILAQEFQLPLIKCIIGRMERSKRLPGLPKGLVTISIVTGMEALGRNHEENKMNTLLQTLPPEVAQQFLKWPGIVKRKMTNLGINPKGLVKTDEDLANEAKQANLQNVTATLGPNIAKGASDIMKEKIKQNPETPVPGQQ